MVAKIRHDRAQRAKVLEPLVVYEPPEAPGRFAISNGQTHKYLPGTFSPWSLDIFWDWQILG